MTTDQLSDWQSLVLLNGRLQATAIPTIFPPDTVRTRFAANFS